MDLNLLFERLPKEKLRIITAIPVILVLLLSKKILIRRNLWKELCINFELIRLQFRALMDAKGISFTEWLDFQYEVYQLLRLEKVHRLETIDGDEKSIFQKPLPHLAHLQQGDKMNKSMTSEISPTIKDIVLVGGGHAHVHILKMFGMNPLKGVQLTLITRDVDTPYSGMIPGHIAGLYTREECHVDLMKLARFSNTCLIHAEVCGIDFEKKTILTNDPDRPPISFDILSIDIGSSPKVIHNTTNNDILVTPVKPIDSFSARWDSFLQKLKQRPKSSIPIRIVIVGGGAGGVELALSMQERLKNELLSIGHDPKLLKICLVNRNKCLLPTHGNGIRKSFERILRERKVDVFLDCEVVRVEPSKLYCSNRVVVEYDECFWCTEGGAQHWLTETGLELDTHGFIRVHTTLESINKQGVFAAGDICSIEGHPRPKAGVFAVRAGAKLYANLQHKVLGEPLEEYIPQSKFLGLITTGQTDLCVASKGLMVLEGAWLWKLKDWIDRKWMYGYTTGLPEMPSEEINDNPVALASGADALKMIKDIPMRCGGCGAKVGASVLSQVFRQLNFPTREEVLIGLNSPDDCALVAPKKIANDNLESDEKESYVSVQTVDFFRSFVNDPFIFGQIAANHALSDCFAMCAEPISALAIAVVPYGLEDKVKNTLLQMMAGASVVLRKANCALVGGHTCEGKELSLGFSIYGSILRSQALLKGGMKVGQKLILTKPLGTGVLFAAEMRMKTKARYIENALKVMLQSNESAAKCFQQFNCTSCTDVTGFGLVGHLYEMAKASHSIVTLDLDSIPILHGTLDAIEKNIFSSLQAQNVSFRRIIKNSEYVHTHPHFPVIFDPQTSGGLLASVAESDAQACLLQLKQLGFHQAAIIGEVTGKIHDYYIDTDQSLDKNGYILCSTN